MVLGISAFRNRPDFRSCACQIWLGLKIESVLKDGDLTTRLLFMLDSEDAILSYINNSVKENWKLGRRPVWSPDNLVIKPGITWKAERKRTNSWIASNCLSIKPTSNWNVHDCSLDWQPKYKDRTILTKVFYVPSLLFHVWDWSKGNQADP